ncbi:hypothetical protein INQ93_00840 [Chlamydia suis]|uniref:Inclusion membrane protein-56 n=1 Tax=Chlamydia suis TaxID=83559 RepID=A0AAQ0ELH5_9CHLA|nr:hypothetical protein [Chlamydia suis]MEB2681384.1 hypothetical protein [Chlamydia suis]MEB2681746.1 hypothetical protein [Chlamydia suis]MEB2682667.1 hypothetical protein [Chlamydia suis]MEB2684091.1 hypothetical protein [Chlamydia suis]MEB2684482.1 hypothetical protein [Chlamydia suis]
MADEMQKESPSQEPSSSKFGSFKQKVRDLHASPKVGGMKRFLSRHAREAISGALIVFGIIANCVSWVGGLFVASGIVLGFYPEILAVLQNLQSYYAKNGPIKNALICGVSLYWLIKAPSFVLSFIVLCIIVVLLAQGQHKDTPRND